MKSFFTSLLILFAFFSVKLFALNIVSHPINGLILQDGSGSYPKILETINKMINTQYSLEVLPLKRAIRHFISKHDDCLLSGGSTILKNPNQYLVSEPLSEIKLHLFNLKDQVPISSFSALNQEKLIGGIRGIEGLYDKVLPENLKLELVASDEQNLNMLIAQRTQAIIGFIPDLNSYLDTLHYDKSFVIYHGSDNLICHDTKEARSYLKQINQALIELKSSPVYHEIMP